MTSPAPLTQGPQHRQILAILSGLMLGMFLASLDQTIVSTAMRTIADRLDGQTAQAWATTAYLVTSTVTTPLYGKLSDIYGRKPFYLFAIVVFVIGSVLCGQAHSIYELAAYRALQGVGAGGLMSLAFAIIGDIVAPRERARYQAYIMSVFATSSVLGPVLGGYFAGHEHLLGLDGWRWIFYLNVPVGLAAFAVVWRNLHLPNRRTDHPIDYLGAATLVASVVPVLLVAEKGREWGWGSGATLGLLALSAVSLAVFLPWERRLGDDAILPLRIFSNSVFTATSVVAFLLGAGMFGGLVLMPLYLQIVKGASPTEAGLQMIPFMVGMMGSSLTVGRIMRRTGKYRVFPIVGTAIALVGSLLFSTMTADTPLPQVMSYMLVMGVGLGLSMQMLMIAAQNALPMSDMGLSTATTTFFRAMGGTFGAAVSLALLFSTVLGNIRERMADAGLSSAFTDQLDAKALDNTTKLFEVLPPPVRHMVLQGFADSMHTVFVVTAVTMALAFVGTWFVKEEPLREHSPMHSPQEEASVL
ncbi:MAG TPA: MDR family MFS transporter [Mycobacteriales bacterium]|nr:MDR family MFS transporter [Mycobacteriales bacterium]